MGINLGSFYRLSPAVQLNGTTLSTTTIQTVLDATGQYQPNKSVGVGVKPKVKMLQVVDLIVRIV